MKVHDIFTEGKFSLNNVSVLYGLSKNGYESWTIRKLSTEELMLLNCGVGEDS